VREDQADKGLLLYHCESSVNQMNGWMVIDDMKTAQYAYLVTKGIEE
jgi:hypothetical protein